MGGFFWFPWPWDVAVATTFLVLIVFNKKFPLVFDAQCALSKRDRRLHSDGIVIYLDMYCITARCCPQIMMGS